MGSDELVRGARGGALDHLDDAGLARAVQELGPEGMRALVARVGLADAGHWLSLATPAQVLEVLDAELWEAADAGENERFDPRRFVTWLEALVEVGVELAADRLADAPQELVVAGLYRQALVFDTDELWLAVARGLVDPVIEDYPHLEIGEYLMVGRGLDGWDAVVAAMLELADRHPETAAAVLDQCRALTDRSVGEAGVAEALLDEEGGEEEAALEREDRRARRGFVAPHAARSFLALAVEVDLETQLAFGGRDPVTAAYFREWDASAPAPGPTGLARAGVAGARPEELGYLVQVVIAGCETGGRRFTVEEAAEAVLAVCRLGEAVAGPAGPADALFRYGYHTLHARVVRRAREAGDRTGLADPIPKLDGRFVGSLAEVAEAEARLAAGVPTVEVEGVVERRAPELPPFVAVPAGAAAALGAARATLVVCRIGATERRRTLKPWDAERWLVELPPDWCREAGIAVGDRVTLRMRAADERLPKELAAALAADREARERWHALPEARQREWSEHVRKANRAEVRARRAAVLVARLRG